jgi:N-methylhydantoinase A
LGRYRLGVDVGGTFTDLVLFDEETQELWVHKTPTTLQDQAEGVSEGLSALLRRQEAAPEDLVYLAQGSTVAINAMLEGRTAPVGIITTEGFRDLLELRRQRRPSLYDLFFQMPQPLVPRHLRLAVPERVNSSGDVLVPLDEGKARQALQRLAQAGVSSVAVCFLFSFLNPRHELKVEELAKEVLPSGSIWLSHRVLPEFREFERLSTTVCNAALGPTMEKYLGNLGGRIAKMGCGRPPYIMQSNGGVMSLRGALERPANTLFSGPSAGVVGGLGVARLAGTENAITLDMGGTSTDVCLVRQGVVSMVQEKEIAGTPVRTPMVDVNSVGAGGGSIAGIDAGGRLKVGPQSAGAHPGPAAYGQGGELPTVTDANLVLGRLSPRGLLAGRMPLYPQLALEAVDRHVAQPLGLSPAEAAWGIIQIVNTNTVLAIRAVSVQRGHDPREFTLVAFGGAGPLHAPAVARLLGISRVVVPPAPGILCAQGLLATDMRTDYVQTLVAPLLRADLRQVNRLLSVLEGRANAWLDAEAIGPEDRKVELSADLRYVGQNYELSVAAPAAPWRTGGVKDLAERFHQEHNRAYGYRADQATVQLVNLRVTALATMPKLKPRSAGNGAPAEIAPFEHRDVWWGDGFVSTPVYLRSGLPAGSTVPGPAVVEQMDSTILIAPKEQGQVDEYGNLILFL